MGKLILISGAKRKNRYQNQFSDWSVDRLVDAFNREVGNNGWVAARAEYLVSLRDTLLATGLDCSSFIDDGGMNMDEHISRKGKRLIPAAHGNRERE